MIVRPGDIENLHAGEPCVLLANGPSILEADLSRVKCLRFGINRSWKLLPAAYHYAGDMPHLHEIRSGAWRPNFFFTTQERWDRFLPAGAPFPVCYLRMLRRLGPEPRFSHDLREGVHVHGASTVALQIAVWLGFNPIYFLGLDLSWPPERGHFYDSLAAPNLPSGNMPEKQEAFFRVAALELETRGIRVVNLNPRSWSQAFEKASLESIFPQEHG